jgi:hypothetical protein
MSKIDRLGYEQLIALRVIRDTPDMEGSAICKQADCSFDELFRLAQHGLINLGEERLQANMVHPTLTGDGLAALVEAEQGNVI